MLAYILALVVTIIPYHGYTPLLVEIRIKANGYAGAMCLTVDGPEFHRSCWARLLKDPEVKITHYLLRTAGEYVVTIDTSSGTQSVGIIRVLE